MAFIGMGISTLNNVTREINEQVESRDINVEQLKKLKELFDEGVITQEEFDKAKKKMLGI